LAFVNALCQLARFHFVSWRVFTLPVGAFSLCQLARFHFVSWRRYWNVSDPPPTAP